jgi:hypothetical protein
MWYPFNDGDESIKFNYMIDFQINNNNKNNNNYINKMKKYKIKPI